MQTVTYMSHFYAFVSLNNQALVSVELSLCVVFVRSGFNNKNSRTDLSHLYSKYGSCYQTLCYLSMSKRFILHVFMFTDIISIMYVITFP